MPACLAPRARSFSSLANDLLNRAQSVSPSETPRVDFGGQNLCGRFLVRGRQTILQCGVAWFVGFDGRFWSWAWIDSDSLQLLLCLHSSSGPECMELTSRGARSASPSKCGFIAAPKSRPLWPRITFVGTYVITTCQWLQSVFSPE